MRCPVHLLQQPVGYCCECGTLGCAKCLTEHEGNLYCKKHYKPIEEAIRQKEEQAAIRKKHHRHKLVVRYKDGRTVPGMCFALNPKSEGFHLDIVDERGGATGEREHVFFDRIKAVFNVKSFDGRHDRLKDLPSFVPSGGPMVVKFEDGEVAKGIALHPHPTVKERFYLIPEDEKSNNISILIEGSAVEAIYTSDEYAALRQQEKEAKKEGGESTQVSQEETMGDFHFQSGNYDDALGQYRLAAEKTAMCNRIRKKLVVSTYNVGINHLKRHSYPKALQYMEEVLKIDPDNERALKKAQKLKRSIDKTKRHMDEIKRKSDASRAEGG